jgi:hypothetical protein
MIDTDCYCKTVDQIIDEVSQMRKFIPMVAMTALFTTTMIAANDILA